MQKGKYIFITIVISILVISLILCVVSCKTTDNSGVISSSTTSEATTQGSTSTSQESVNTEANDRSQIKTLIEDFGKVLVNVSLLSPSDLLENDMKKYYSPFLSEELILQWIKDPPEALGRLTSSPWPDHIEVIELKKITADKYEVNGNVIEITSVEAEKGGYFDKYEVNLTVERINTKWLITRVTKEAVSVSETTSTQNQQQIEYINTQYGFSFSLPISWKEYSIIITEWEGSPIGGETIIEKGPIISIRNPKWTQENPYQDIPIMVFTTAQWESLQQEKFHIGAAPIGPSELGHNSKYVFALPARYNFAYPAGVEEVEKILEGNPLKVF